MFECKICKKDLVNQGGLGQHIPKCERLSLIKDEIIGYTTADTATNTITGIIRGTIPESYDANQLVFKYEMNGVYPKKN